MPVLAIPAAMAKRFCSAIPMLKNRSGNAWMNGMRSVYFDRSADSATTSGLRRARSMRALPNGASIVARGGVCAFPLLTVRLVERCELRFESLPIVGLDPHEMRLLTTLQAGQSFPRRGAQDDGVRHSASNTGPLQRLHD